MKRFFSILVLALAACEPPPPALEGAPPAQAEAGLPPGELAGGDPLGADAALPSVIGIVPPMGVRVIESCETVIAADYNNPPKMTCLLFQSEDVVSGELDAGVFVAISDAGWNFVRLQGDQHYFERPRAGTDCAEVAVLSVLTDRLQAVVDSAGVGAAAGPVVWQAYAIPTSTHDACGADRMKP